MKTHVTLQRIALIAVLEAASACYNEVSIGMSVPQPQSRIVAQLTDIGADRLARAIGVGATEVEGIVAAADDSTWQLYVLRVDQRGGGSTPWNRELVTFPRSTLTNVSEKRLDKKKSWVVAGVATVGAFLLERLVTGAFSPGDEGRGSTLPPGS
jgi:hypothetical protein